MHADYPAAHSMDTDWFAVDRDGRVGYFSSGENGPVPVGQRSDADLEELVVNHLRAAAGQPGLSDDDWFLAQDEAYLTSLGIFVFTHPHASEWVEPYARGPGAGRPVHVDQLPPHVRDQCRRVRFPISFAEVEGLQPCEFVECSHWGYSAGYVCGDGKTLRAFPGHEEELRRLWATYCRNPWAQERGLRVEGDEGPPG
jgi:hypothetical protein